MTPSRLCPTVGMLGLNAAASVQSWLHHVTGSVQPQGWSHQISSGVAGSIGTVTEASLALNARWGRVESAWWAFAPEENMYVPETHPLLPPLGLGAPPELFAFVGARGKSTGV